MPPSTVRRNCRPPPTKRIASGSRSPDTPGGRKSIADAVAAGFDGLEYGGFFTPDGVSADPAVIDAMATNQVFVSSTGATTAPLAESVYDAEILKRLPGVITAYERMRAAGVPIVMSSDAGVTPAKPHDVLPFGARLLARLGYPNADTLRAPTAWPAAARVSATGKAA